MQQLSGIERADRIGRARAQLFPVAGILLIVLNAVASGNEPGPLARAAWLALFGGCFVLVVSGGVLLKRLRVLTDDESAWAHRRSAVFVGYCAGIACAVGLYVVSAYEPVSARQALQIVLTTALAAPLISFGALERRALG